VAGGGLDAVSGDAHLVHRRVGLLHRARDNVGVLDREEASVVGEALLGPRVHEDVDGLLEALAALLLRDLIATELRGPVAAAHTHVQAAARDDVDQRELLGQAQRVMEGQDGRG
jgi:hypothetical protein